MAHSLKLEGFFRADGANPDFLIEPFWWRKFRKEDPRLEYNQIHRFTSLTVGELRFRCYLSCGFEV